MSYLKRSLLLAILFIAGQYSRAQNAGAWNNKSCAVVLTYDDAIDIDLDHVVPALDS